MTTRAYYNEIDGYACNWLCELMANGLIMEGDIDQRSICDVSPRDLRGYTRVHFFAGIAGWDYALQLAGWPDDAPVWTGSCPCQPFSAAGKQLGTADKRHLWPEFRRLIAECRPATVFGEQVASKPGREWLAGVRADLEALGYGVGAADLCAAGVGAPHIRQRLWLVADAHDRDAGAEWQQRSWQQRFQPEDRGAGVELADAVQPGWPEWRPVTGCGSFAGGGGVGALEYSAQQQHGSGDAGSRRWDEFADASVSGQLGDTESKRLPRRPSASEGDVGRGRASGQSIEAGFWSDHDLIPCRDGKARRVEPGSFPLAHGVPARVAKLRAFGNAIVPQIAAEFIKAYSAAKG